MLELGSGPAPAGDLIKDSAEATFMQDVVEESKSTPVIVDFWAPWCGPCKTLGPALEAAVREAGGKVRMVKINVDENQALAGQMRVQSIPSVFAFSDGQPVDGFQGALPPSEIKAFVEKIAALGGGDDAGLEEAVAAAEEMLKQGAAVDAAQTFAAVLGEEPANAAALAGLAKSHIALGESDKALALLENAPEEISEDPGVLAVKAQIELAAGAVDAGATADLRRKLEADGDDHQSRLDLGLALMADGNPEAAISELLELFRRDRDWNDAAAKEQLFKIFESLGPKDAIAQTGRRKLSSMIFA
ncbi:MAG: thioredoxin [Rhodobacteraceae bacterium]|nr:thioredoxin [Paracoccaceae bacterium]